MPSKFQLVTELYNEALESVTDNHREWTGFLRAACYNYKCPFDEQILIYAQKPSATAVLPLNDWNQRFGHWVNRGAKGIALFDDAKGRGRLKYYFPFKISVAIPETAGDHIGSPLHFVGCTP